jgi:hypothetical protein
MLKRRRNKSLKVGLIFLTILFILASTSISYSLWNEGLSIDGMVHTGVWGEPNLCIQKSVDGSYTDPVTGKDLTVPNYDLNLIHRSSRKDPGFPTKFKLKFELENSGTETYTDVSVSDKIGNIVAPRIIITITHGSVTFQPYGLDRQKFGHDFMHWNIGTLSAGETAILEIWIETLKNKPGLYEPTSEDQSIVVNDLGAGVTATNSEGLIVYAETEGITIDIDPYEEPNDNIAIIAAPELPYATPWACIN